MTVFCECHIGIKLSGNESISRRENHIDITSHYVRDVFTQREAGLQYKLTIRMVVDLFVEPLESIGFQSVVARAEMEIRGPFEATYQREC